MSETLKEKTSKGLFWGTINNGGQQILNLIFGIFLARLLNAEDYGMIGMIMIFSVIASSLMESGFISALANKKEVTHDDLNAVFWFNILVGILLYVILFFCAPLIADFFEKPTLVPLSRITFLMFVISSFGITPRAILFRNLQTKETAISSISALVISGTVGVILAYNGMSYWGISIQYLVSCLVMTLSCWYFAHWKPSFTTNFRPLHGMIGFSSKLLVTNIFTNIYNNLFSVLFGKFYSQTYVGNYTQANKWNSMGYSFITGTLQGVAQPVLAQVRDDHERQKMVFRKMLRFTAFISFPIMFGLSLVSYELIVITITQKWVIAASFLQILCIDGAFIPINRLYSNLIISKGRSNIYMWNTITICLLQLAVMLSLRSYDVYVLITTFVVIDILWMFVWHYFVWRIINLRLQDAIKDVFPFAFIATLSMIVSYWLTSSFENIYLVFLLKIVIATTVYLGTLWMLDAKILKESIDFFLKKKSEVN